MQLGPGTMVTSNVRLVRPLGEGGMGSVWVADHLGLDTEVAVKFISAELAKDEHVRVRFSREAKATAQIKSPHVVQTFDHGFMPDGTPYIVMEMLHGASLADWLALEGRMRTADVAIVVSQVASALTKAHQLGIVHRDIKPANVFMIGSENETFVKVLDFGIAKRGERRAAGITQTGVMVGTPEYMSPEQVLSSRDVDHRADLWALAVMAYEMLTGRRPFDGETVGALCVAVAQARFVRPTALVPDLSPDFDELFARALAKRRTDRFQTALEFAEAFERIAGVATRSGAFAAGSAGAEDYKDKRARRDTGRSPDGRAASAPRAAATAIGLDARAQGARARGPNGGGAGALPSRVGMSFGPGLKSAASGPAVGSGLRGVPGGLPESGLIPISVTEPVSPRAPAAEPATVPGSHWEGPTGRDSSVPPGTSSEPPAPERPAPREPAPREPAPPEDAPRALPRRQRSSATVEIEAPPESTRSAEPLGSAGASGAGSASATTPAERPPTQRIALEFDPARERARAALAAQQRAHRTAPPIRAAWLLAAALAVVGTSVAAHFLEPHAIASTAQRLGGSGYIAYVVGSAVLLVGAKLMADASHRQGSLTLWLATVGLVLVAACGGVTAASLAGAEVATLARAARHTAPFASAAVPLGLSLFGLHEARNELFGPVRRPPFGVLLVVVALAGLGAGARLVQRAPVFGAAASEPRPG